MSVDQVQICGELFFFSSFFFFPPFFVFLPFFFSIPIICKWDGFSPVTILFFFQVSRFGNALSENGEMMGNPKKKKKKKVFFGEVQILTTAFGPPNFQMEIKWLLLIHSLKKNTPIKIHRSAPD